MKNILRREIFEAIQTRTSFGALATLDPLSESPITCESSREG